MNFTRTELENYLKERLIGQAYTVSWNFNLTKAFRTFLMNKGLDEKYFYLSQYGVGHSKSAGQMVYIIYRPVYEHEQELGYIMIKKVRGDYHAGHGYLSGWYDWSFKDIEVHFYKGSENFDDLVSDADQKIAVSKAEENQTKHNALEVYKFAHDKFGEGTKSVIDYLKYHYSEVAKLINEQVS